MRCLACALLVSLSLSPSRSRSLSHSVTLLAATTGMRRRRSGTCAHLAHGIILELDPLATFVVWLWLPPQAESCGSMDGHGAGDHGMCCVRACVILEPTNDEYLICGARGGWLMRVAAPAFLYPVASGSKTATGDSSLLTDQTHP